MFAVQAAASDYWDFGGTWSSDPAGVWFDMDVRNTIGMEKSIPVKISDRAMGAKSAGFMNKHWMAKANAKYGRLGPVSLFAINRSEKNVAVFVGNTIIHSKIVVIIVVLILRDGLAIFYRIIIRIFDIILVPSAANKRRRRNICLIYLHTT